MFSRPDSSGWKPAPSSSMADTRPFGGSAPDVGRWMPAISLSSVDLPEPLCPISPYVVPRGMSKRDVVERPEVLVPASPPARR